MPLDFPNSPAVNATFSAPNGVVYTWDGTKWAVQAGAGAGVASFNTRTGAVTLSSGDVTTALTFTPASTVGPVFTGDARAVTPTAGDNDTSVATTAFVQAASRNTNLANNTGFFVNQRGYVSGSALASGAFGHDRWKGGAGGGTYTFTQSGGPSTVVTITAGTLQQVVEGAGLVGGNYMLTWTGTAQGRVGAGSYAASPVSVAGITAGANTTIEFNTGTLSQVKFEAGSVATAWFPLSPRDEVSSCQRFFQTWANTIVVGYAAAGGTVYLYLALPTTMRSPTPTVTPQTPGYFNASGLAVSAVSASDVRFSIVVTALGSGQCIFGTFLSAEL